MGELVKPPRWRRTRRVTVDNVTATADPDVVTVQIGSDEDAAEWHLSPMEARFWAKTFLAQATVAEDVRGGSG